MWYALQCDGECEAPGVFASVSSTRGYASCENQFSFTVVCHDVTGCQGAVFFCVFPAGIEVDGGVVSPVFELCDEGFFFPFFGGAGFGNGDVEMECAAILIGLLDRCFEFVDAGAAADALRMKEHSYAGPIVR